MTERDSGLGTRHSALGRGLVAESPSVHEPLPSPEYVELHCHSAFSFLDGASHPDALVERALTLGYHALALTDHDELGGIVAFAQAGYNNGLECIVGAEVTVEVPEFGTRDAGGCPSQTGG